MDAVTRPAVTIDRSRRHTSAQLDVRQITPAQHQAFVASRPSVSFLQVPQWAAVKPDWESESIGWLSVDGRLVGAALVLYRRIPKLNRSLAYLPEGPVIDWGAPDLARWLEPLVEHLRSRGVFTVRMGPPVQRRWWEAPTLKSAIAGGLAERLGDVTPDGVGTHADQVMWQLREQGWRPAPGYDDAPESEGAAGFSAGQPRYVFQVPLGGRSLDEVFSGFNQLWRRNIRTSEKAGVEVVPGDPQDLDTFHELYVTTAARDGFTPRPTSYFPRMWQSLDTDFSRSADGATAPGADQVLFTPGGGIRLVSAGSPAADFGVRVDAGLSSPGQPDMRLYLARYQGRVLASSILVRVGDHAWYSYGASADHDRRLKPSNALQWRMLSDSHAAGATLYDLRGMGASLKPDAPLFGLTRFKVGSGGRAVEYLGEWEMPLNRLLHRAVGAYLARR
jgi:lipid II:glycine glycyltransferase (peptidoglycan interpeptide bridge formation enzyme)